MTPEHDDTTSLPPPPPAGAERPKGKSKIADALPTSPPVTRRISLRDYAIGKPRYVLHILASECGDPRIANKPRPEWDALLAKLMKAATTHSA